MRLRCREDVCAQLEGALTACTSATAGVVLLEGAVGCGKTEMLLHVAERAERLGALVLRAAGSAQERDVPYGVLRQLTAGLPADTLPTGTLPAEAAGREPLGGRELIQALRTAADRTPVVVCVDDLHHTDPASLDRLLDVARAVRGERLLLVLADAPHEHAESPLARTEFLRHPGFTRILLGRLDEPGTAALLEDHTGRPATAADTAWLHGATGGNPLLLRALLSERPRSVRGPADRWPEPAPGGPFTQAALTCLHRDGADSRTLAVALAVLGDDATPELTARLAGTGPTAAARAAAALEASGLTEDGRLRHPAVAAAVLDGVSRHELALLRTRAAHVLHESGARAAAVAPHLLAAAEAGAGPEEAPRGDWPVQVLREAALQVLVDDEECDHAAACLELARTLCADEQTGWEIGLQLAAVTWRKHPAAAERHLDGPLAALRRGALGPAAAGRLARLLVAQGRIEDAAEALERMADPRAAARTTREDPLRELFALPPAAASAAPSAPAAGPGAPGDHPGGPARTGTAELRSSAALWTHPDGAGDEQAAERLLTGTPLAHATFDPIVQAVRTLVHADRPDRAVVWCRRLQAETQPAGSPGWQSVFGLVHSEALLRLGDLAGAEREASAAVDAVADRGGLFLFGPVATLVTALTAMGRYDAVARRLQMPVPEELFSSVYALNYLRARGYYYLATHRHRAALGEFLDAGRLAQRWGLDRPRQLPWRTDAAEALLRLGEHRQAERFVVEQLATSGVRSPRVRGVSLRLRAATSELRQRPKLLTRAVDELSRSGDRLELAKALADLGRALLLLGEGTRAGMVTRRAWHLAADCGAVPLCGQIMPGQTGTEQRTEPVQRTEETPETEQLSESERRVAALAAYGYTNREISAKLYVTVSTVEQHLTRAYRKLGISRRQDLPMSLQFDSLESAFPGVGVA
ncbi:LuxR family transcriptional regulator [Streptomyces sp. NBC_00091]|uniref:helix-turn-helix transcriptional regulator n=1 Tax=Streptomyces sp. NBC_00091 TaxID=2975648 RepID=UPI00225760A7|nr:LuxR family transcriptional regulator [Streptomyces sp. NBC_00091]MCX5381008.1 AAA family ATPase [Streptomyces sp. NBC_00091]